jgi:predicted nuclease of predicted toxin-antitoxin system
VKFLVDNDVSPFVAKGLAKAGYDTIHVVVYELHKAEDQAILERSAIENRIVITIDTDFGELLAKSGSSKAFCHPNSMAEVD